MMACLGRATARGLTMSSAVTGIPSAAGVLAPERTVLHLREHTVEIVSDSGEGAQKCGQIFGAVCAKMGNGVWTVEIIPAEIQPPPRIPEGRERHTAFASASGRSPTGATRPTSSSPSTSRCCWRGTGSARWRRRRDRCSSRTSGRPHDDADIRAAWDGGDGRALRHGTTGSSRCRWKSSASRIVDNPAQGEEHVRASACSRAIYGRDMERIQEQIALRLPQEERGGVRAERRAARARLRRGPTEHLDFRIEVPGAARPTAAGGDERQRGARRSARSPSGMELCAMYPITPATSVSHYLGEVFERFGGIVHQAEDEIAAAGVAIGASYAGKVAFTVTSGPGLALKTEFLGLAVMTEIPLVVDRRAARRPEHRTADQGRAVGPARGAVRAAGRRAARGHRAGDDRGVLPRHGHRAAHRRGVPHGGDGALRRQPRHRRDAVPAARSSTRAGRRRRSTSRRCPTGTKAVRLGRRDRALARGSFPGQPGGMYTVTGLSHDEGSKVAYSSGVHQRSSAMRSRKLAVLQSMLAPPAGLRRRRGRPAPRRLGEHQGRDRGGGGPRARARDCACRRCTCASSRRSSRGSRRSSRASGRSCTVEINYSDEPDDPFITDENRRRGQLAWLLRAATLVDVDCWTRVPGEPLRPGAILDAIRDARAAGRCQHERSPADSLPRARPGRGRAATTS